MGWGRYLLLGDFGQQMDLGDQQRAMENLRTTVEGQRHRDAQQDMQLRELAAENVELKLTLNRFAALLVQRGVISPEDVAKIVGELEQAERVSPGSPSASRFQNPRNP